MATRVNKFSSNNRSSIFFTLTTLITAAFSSEAMAADFSHAQKTYVPSPTISQRYDTEIMQAKEASPTINGEVSESDLVPDQIDNPPKTIAANRSQNNFVPPPPPIGTSDLPSAPSSTAAPQTRSATVSTIEDPLIVRAQTEIDNLLAQGKYDDAYNVVIKYLRAYPRNKTLRTEWAKIMIARARNYMKANELELARSTVREALAEEPKNNAANALLNELLEKRGINPNSEQDRLKVADELLAQNRLMEAKVEYKIAQRIKPTARGHVGLGAVYSQENKKDDAKVQFEQAIKLDANCQSAYRELGNLKYYSGDLVGANTDLSRALILDSNDQASARILIDLWQHQVAKYPNDVNNYLGLGRAHLLVGNLPAAQNDYRQVVRLDPQNPSLPAARNSFKLALARSEAKEDLLAAHSLETQGAIQDAYRKASDAVGLCPHNIEMRLYLADLKEKLGMISEAREDYLVILQQDPKNQIAAQHLKATQATVSVPSQLVPAVPNVPAPGANQMPPVAPPVAPLRPALPATPQSSPSSYLPQGSMHVCALANFAASVRSWAITEQKKTQSFEEGYRTALLNSNWTENEASNSSPTAMLAASTVTLISPSSTQYARLEIEGVSVTPDGAQLKVKLKNGYSKALKMRSDTKAILCKKDQPEEALTMHFPATIIEPGSIAHGTIDVPEENLTAVTGLYIPSLPFHNPLNLSANANLHVQKEPTKKSAQSGKIYLSMPADPSYITH
jgi:tetratricopeptide (TPR) repeat protein